LAHKKSGSGLCTIRFFKKEGSRLTTVLAGDGR
jgi:hypothetical protein